ncbi:hypothetical protein BT93_H1804 [Corymbia citriodora subsp. variegata]|nr:hypothetical protein BT93_H1804 [Corymbia citriodora subsp. variegata]
MQVQRRLQLLCKLQARAFSCAPASSSSPSSRLEAHYDRLLKNSCDDASALKQIHSSLTTRGLITQDPHLSAQVIIRYSKYGHPDHARSLFDGITARCERPDSFLWNTMVRAYANNGYCADTLELYALMRRGGVLPNNYTFPFVLKACASDSEPLARGWEVVHGETIKTGFDSDMYVEAALVDAYAKRQQISYARKVFDGMMQRDLVCWTTMVTAYEQAEQPQESLMLFCRMQREESLSPDPVAVVSVASAVGQVGDLKSAKSVHAYAIQNGILRDICVGNSVVAMYTKCGNVEYARMAFDRMEERDKISWNSMLSGYVQNGQANEALLLFEQMQDSGCQPNPVTALIMVSACAFLGSRHLGKKIHDYILKNEMKVDITLQNALIDMYSKCGNLETASKMFYEIHPKERDVSSWNVLISAYGMHGRGEEALNLYMQMQEKGVAPNHITFTSILSACSHAGLINEGRKCFADMSKLSVKPEVKHYACMVDMLGRAGLLDEAFDLIKSMPASPNDGVWGALLLACRVHGNSELGEIAANNLFQIEPEHPGYYVLLSNIYAASRRWQEVGKLRENMKTRGLSKPAAFSVIEYGQGTIGFHTADQLNPYRGEVYRHMERLVVEMKMRGYLPDRSCVLHDVEDEDKDHILNYHSEKLAVAFGLMRTDPESAITVSKNLRICNDCHSTFKFLSDIYQRWIVVRDANRFHHFQAGSCSCKDYW